MTKQKPKPHQIGRSRPTKSDAPQSRESKPRAHREPNGESGNGHARLIAVPHVGPGRKRMVPAESLDGLAVRLANELAAETVSRIRVIVDRMVKRAIEDAIGKF